MGKDKRFSNSLGDKLLEAWRNPKAIPVSPAAKTSTATTPKSSKVPENVTVAKPKPHAIPKKRPVPLHHLRYDASGKKISAMTAEYRSASNVTRRTIVEGLRAHYYDLQRKTQTLEVQRRLSEVQDLLNDINSGCIDKPEEKTKMPLTIKQRGTCSSQHSQDKTPDLVKSTRRYFGSGTQFNNSSREICDVVIGLDFGTACTKVVLRTPLYADRVFMVPFGEFGHSTCEYLLPTHLNINQNYYFLPKGNEKGWKSDLKLQLLSSLKSVNEEDAVHNAIAYIALVFRYVRTWFLNTQKDIYGDLLLDWHVNVGVPSETAQNNDLCMLYTKVITAAWAVSASEGDVTLRLIHDVQQGIHLGKYDLELFPPVHAFPEIAAEVAGYTKSDLRREGLHLMIDVGAGTVDICGFNVVRINKEDRLPLFSTSVQPHGVKFLHHARRTAVIDSISEALDDLSPDGGAPLPGVEQYIPDQELSVGVLKEADSEFFRQCRTQLFGLASHLKKMVPAGSAWNDEFRLFLCGGGSSLKFYADLISEISQWLKDNTSNKRAKQIHLPRQKNLVTSISDDQYHRFGVAVGLSHLADDFDRVMLNIKPVVENDNTPDPEPWFMKLENAYLVDY